MPFINYLSRRQGSNPETPELFASCVWRSQRRVSAADAQALAADLNLEYVEASALQDVNVHQAFLKMACSVKVSQDAKRLAMGEKPKLNLKSEPAASSSTWLASLCPRSLYGAI